MDTFTVYLFVRDRSQSTSATIERRLQSLKALRDELIALGVQVTALPDEADLQVEIRNVFGTNEGSDGKPLAGSDGHRVLIIRLLIGEDPVEFVCSDGIGNVPAENHAAKRVLVWLHNLARCPDRAAKPIVAAFTVSLSTN
jgi:hypothetical protein